MKIGLRSAYSQRNGYGKDGVGLARAILDRGHDLRTAPTMVDVPIPKDIAMLFTLPYDYPLDLAIYHVEPQSVQLSEPNSHIARKNICWTMIGWDSIEHARFRDDFAERIKRFDHLVVYDPSSLEAVSGYFPSERTHMVMGGYEADAWSLPTEPVERPQVYTFGMLGLLGPRKGPMSAILGFMRCREKYGDDFQAQLVLRTNFPFIPEGTKLPEGVYVEVGYWNPKQVQHFYWSIDTFLAPSSAEGKNLPPMEALASGTNVILSDLPSHKMWCDPSMATFVETQRAEIAANHEGLMVHPEVMAEAMWDDYTNEAKYRLRAFQAAQRLPAQMDWSKCLERLSLTLNLGL